MNYFEKKQWIRLGICVVVLIAVSLFLTGIIGGKNLTYQLPENVEETKAVELPQGENVKTATAKGFASDVTVAVTMEGEKITALTVDDSGESYPVAREDSVEKVIAAIIEANGTEGVDVNTGATFTCTAIVNAVNEAMGKTADAAKEVALTPGTYEAETASGQTTETAGTVTGTATVKGYGGDVTVTVTLENGKIIAVEMTGDGETNGIGHRIIDEWPQVFVENDGILDTYTGATFAGITRQAVIEATRNALTDAGVNPDDYLREETAEGEAAELIIEADIVIAGAGGAGMTAALTAADAGKSVLVLESQPAVGGNSVKSTGGMNASKTVFQDKNEFGESAGIEKTLAAAENYADNEAITALAATVKEQWEAWQAAPEGYFDSPELFALDTLIGGKGLNDPELVNTLVNNSAAAIDWLSTVGIDLNNVAAFGGASVKRIHRPVNDEGKVVSVGAYTIPRLEQACAERNNLALMTDVTVTRILTDDSGAVCGVEALGKNGNLITVKAKAVIIATGGFGANLEMVASYAPQLEGFMTTNAAGIQGQGILMAAELGAATVDMDQIQIHPTVQADTASLITEGLRGDGAILINANGERFIDEVGTRDVVSAAEIAQPGSFSWLVVDQKMVDASSVIQGYISRGLMISGGTYEELADNLGIPADTFAATMAAWNGYVADKNDPDFGRTSFANPLDTAPYYAVKVTAGIHHTMGGLKIDTETHVLKESGEIIPGLYAAGEVTGGVHGANRLGGNAVADFVVFGRIAGETAVKELSGTAEPAGEPEPETAEEQTADKNDNVKTVTKQGYDNGDVIVTVTVGDGNKVENLEIDASSQTPGLGQKAMEEDFIKQFIGKTGPFAYGDGIDAITNATMTSNAVLDAINEVLGIEATPDVEPEPTSEPETTETVTTDSDTTETEQNAAQVSPSVIQQVMVTMGNNSENNIVIDYLEQDPYLTNIYEGFGFAKDYGSARGHTYTLEDVSKTQRPHSKANCITCKTDDFAKMVNTEGISVYSMPFDDVIGQMNNTISCYTCHGDGMGTDGQVTVTHSYVNTALGEAAGDIPAAILACGQCHIEYYFTPSDSETMMPYHSKAEMVPEAILAYYDGMGFYDWEQPGTGTKMLKAQHPETETVLNSGHFAKTGMTCADCHMPVQTTEDGTEYKSHTFISPIQNETLLDTCAKCHGGAEAVISLVQNTQAKVTARETEVGNKLSALKDTLTSAVAEGKLSAEELDTLRELHREAQWYFDFCYVENSEGAHNSKLSLSCLETSESKIDEAMALMTPAE